MSEPERVPTLPVATEDQTQILKAEFTALQRQQWDALEHATFMGMSAKQAQEYERRARRINDLQRALGINLDPPKSW